MIKRMTVRPAQPADLDAIARILGKSSWRPQDFLNFDCRVAEQGGCVQGFLALRHIGPDEREILYIAVDPAYRRRGIARRLVENALATSQGVCFLEVRESNLAAISLYESIGFQAVGLRENYYYDPTETAIVMRFFS